MPLAVTFDFWNTLLCDTGGIRKHRLDACAAILAEAGATVDRGDLEVAFQRSWDVYVQHWHDNVAFGAVDAVELIVADLDIRLDPRSRLVPDLVRAFTDPPEGFVPPLTDNVAGCLAVLRDAGVRLGIICDVGMTPGRTLRRYLAEHEVIDCFDHWSFSDEVGVFKPDPAIFAHALDGLAGKLEAPVPRERAVHVGDLRRTDVAGAKAFGMGAVRYAGVFDDPGDADLGTDTMEADAVVTDHAVLPAVLGVRKAFDPKIRCPGGNNRSGRVVTFAETARDDKGGV